MLVYCSLCVCNLFIRAGNRGRWPASVKLVTLPYLTCLMSVAGSGVLGQRMALYDYQAQQSDELSFVKGNVISILSKDHPDWWMGELAGNTGIFPANFVGPLH